MSVIAQLLCTEKIEPYLNCKKAMFLKEVRTYLRSPGQYTTTFDIQTLEIALIMTKDISLDDRPKQQEQINRYSD